jgi:hypothetical protein
MPRIRSIVKAVESFACCLIGRIYSMVEVIKTLSRTKPT